LLQDEPARQGGFESVCVVGLGFAGALMAEYLWVAASRPQPLSDGISPRFMGERSSGRFGQPSKSRCSIQDSSKTSGLVSEPCHSVASLKYSFWAPDATALRPAGDSWGVLNHVMQIETDHAPLGSGLSDGGTRRGTMNLSKAIPRERPESGGSSADRTG
jgi:hypothetical protein